MCAPAAIAAASLGVTVASQVAGHIADKKAESANKDASIAAFVQDVGAVVARVTEEQNVAAQRINQGFRATRRAKSRARTAAGEAGVGGFSVDLLLSDSDRQLGEFTQSNLENLGSVERQASREMAAARARRDSRINTGQAPSFLGRGVAIAGAGLSFADFKARNSAGKGGA